jgi:hypothetical protein
MMLQEEKRLIANGSNQQSGSAAGEMQRRAWRAVQWKQEELPAGFERVLVLLVCHSFLACS